MREHHGIIPVSLRPSVAWNFLFPTGRVASWTAPPWTYNPAYGRPSLDPMAAASQPC